ncbi:MAG TPA: hypothetical protein VFT43_12440 [Candidatus Polarisedimenticolia bacterium]|nr:hypothetical protein [Candidatus Polarisedimenticolia bacterium]
MMLKKWTDLTRGAAVGVAFALLACGGKNDSNANRIKPIVATLAIQPPSTSPVVYFKPSPNDTAGDDLVLIDVMLQPSAPINMDAFTLEVTFDPGLVQLAALDAGSNPLGTCDILTPEGATCLGSGACSSPLCCLNGEDVNRKGDLIFGVATTSGLCAATSVSSEVKLATLGFTAASTGTSLIHLIPGQGGCAILDATMDLGIPCDDGGATVTGSR